MSYLKFIVQGGQSSSSSGKEGYFLYESLTATAGQTACVLVGEYRPGEFELEIHVNGILQTLNIDYIEVDIHTVTFLEPLENGETILFSVKAVKHNTVLHEEHVTVKDQTVFTLTNIYHPGRDTLLVFDNGMLLRKIKDYIETDEKTVTFTYPLDAGQRITFHEVV